MSTISWTEGGEERSLRWQSAAEARPPRTVQLVDDTLNADDAVLATRSGIGLLWRGDWANARSLVGAMSRRLERPSIKQKRKGAKRLPEAFHAHRLRTGQRAKALGRLLIEVQPGHVVPLRRAPDLTLAATEAIGEATEGYVVSLRELLSWISAHEWRKKGIAIEELGGGVIRAHYGVFSPTRREYLALVADTPLPAAAQGGVAFDIGTGTGVLAAILARHGVRSVVATDNSQPALRCAAENLQSLGLRRKVTLRKADLFPEGRAGVVVCNPPWLPAKPASPLERAVYDPNSGMLKGFLAGLTDHLVEGGEGWLILSDLAERLKLRTREELTSWFDEAGLEVVLRHDTRPSHGKSQDVTDALHAARAAEITSLWRLRAKA